MGCCNWKPEENEIDIVEKSTVPTKVDSFFDIILHSNSFLDNDTVSKESMFKSQISLKNKSIEKAFLTSLPFSVRSSGVSQKAMIEETQDSIYQLISKINK